MNRGEVFVENIDGWVPIQKSGYQYPLLLSNGQVGCVSIYEFVGKVREFHDLQKLLIIDVLFQDDVGLHREVIEYFDALGDNPHVISKRFGSRNDPVVENSSGFGLKNVE